PSAGNVARRPPRVSLPVPVSPPSAASRQAPARPGRRGRTGPRRDGPKKTGKKCAPAARVGPATAYGWGGGNDGDTTTEKKCAAARRACPALPPTTLFQEAGSMGQLRTKLTEVGTRADKTEKALNATMPRITSSLLSLQQSMNVVGEGTNALFAY